MKIAALLHPIRNTESRLLRALESPRTVGQIVAVFAPGKPGPRGGRRLQLAA